MRERVGGEGRVNCSASEIGLDFLLVVELVLWRECSLAVSAA